MYSKIHMSTKTALMSAWSALGTAAVACTLFAGSVAADGRELPVAVQVSTQRLDLRQPAGAHELYTRLRHAAQAVCSDNFRTGLQPSADPQACYEKALADAIRSANMPLLTQVYLETHTLRQAAAHGIDLPLQVAAK